ncbi:HBR122Cp [Eremothecium sinecaudum]|uniref:HBR122Cp n=1 Tax=Eremothecium sinecaudum TaxID=45286 RepID=A0A109UWU5_9SACH|nr:HBR122Cp [Eremothecium sinecaudum]AMD19023.1 HBR122Cp [Eremothecium sinecaudum]
MIREAVLCALKDRNVIHFKHLWLDSESEDERAILELFSFGDYKDKPINPDPVIWTNEVNRKLQLLTLLSLCEQSRQLDYEHTMRKCGIEDENILEQCLIQLHHIIRLEIDSVNRRVTILRCMDSRDVYNNERPLLLLSQVKRSKQEVIHDLLRWRDKLQNNLR